MNAYYTNGNSVKKIRTSGIPKINVGNGFIEFICSLVAFFTCRAVINIFKVTLSLVCFIAFFGIVGGMDSGSIGLLKGVICCAGCSVIEAIILKSVASQNNSENTESNR